MGDSASSRSRPACASPPTPSQCDARELERGPEVGRKPDLGTLHVMPLPQRHLHPSLGLRTAVLFRIQVEEPPRPEGFRKTCFEIGSPPEELGAALGVVYVEAKED